MQAISGLLVNVFPVSLQGEMSLCTTKLISPFHIPVDIFPLSKTSVDLCSAQKPHMCKSQHLTRQSRLCQAKAVPDLTAQGW